MFNIKAYLKATLNMRQNDRTINEDTDHIAAACAMFAMWPTVLWQIAA